MATLTGWSWEQIGELTLPRLYDLERYWREHPPVGDLVAAYLGYQAPVGRESAAHPATGEAPTGPQWGTLEELAADFQAMGGQVKRSSQ